MRKFSLIYLVILCGYLQAATLQSVTVTPVKPTMQVGQQLQFTLTANYSDGTHVDVTSGGTWNSNNTAVAGILHGLVTAKKVGSTTIKGTFGGLHNTTNLTVTTGPPPPPPPPPAPTISAEPNNPTTQTTASFSFSDTQSGVTFLCSIDGNALTSCTSPQVYSSLGQGDHTFSVVAKDSINQQSTPTNYTWTINNNPPPPPTLGYVQGNYTTPQGTSSSLSLGYNQAETVGDINVVVVGWNDSTAQITSVTDSNQNSYSLAIGPTKVSGTLTQSIYYAPNVAGSNDTVTIQFSPAADIVDLRIAEYKGVDNTTPIDVIKAATGTAGTANSGTATTTNANDLIFGANITTGTTSGPGTGFTQRLLTSPDADIVEDKIVSSVGSYSATAPLSGTWIMQMVAFRAAGSGPPPPPPITVSVSPASVNLGAGAQQQFTATVQNTTNLNVIWSVPSGTGTINSSGVFTAPSASCGTETDTIKATSQADTTKSGTATAVIAGQTTNHSVSLSWSWTPDPSTPNETVTYRVYRGTTSSGPYSQLMTGLTNPTYVDTTVVSGTTYYYVTTAFDSTLNTPESGYSNQATVVVPCP